MFGKAIRNIGRGISKAIKPTPRKPAPVKPGTRGNVEQNYRGIPGLINASAPVRARGKKPTPSIPTPAKPGGVGMTGFKALKAGMMKKGGAVKKAAAKGKK